MNLGNDIAGCGTRPVPHGEIPDVELGSVAIACSGVVGSALCDGHDSVCVYELEIFEGRVGGMTETAAA